MGRNWWKIIPKTYTKEDAKDKRKTQTRKDFRLV